MAALLAGALATVSAAPAVATLPAAVTTVASTEVDMVDPVATPETRSLFAYLRDIDGQGVLFGHQESLYFGESFDHQDGTSSDVLTATGDHPAVIGFDTLETPGMSAADREAKALVLADNIGQAHDVGAISTVTLHMENLVTGGDFADTSGDPLRSVLPGGSHHDDLVAYLDRFATTAQNAVDAQGNPIPIIFRPWHENAGSWFWWGAAFGTPGEYAELFRFTVEYLRDVKGVHNLLYAFSPGGGFGGDPAAYLRTYPGDDFVDVLGYDTYDDTGASDSFLQGLTADLGMLGDLAEERGKISAFTEFGISGGVQPDGQNKNTQWYTDVLEAIKTNPSASRTAYMLTWANYGGATTPYTPVDGEMLPDFLAYHGDPYTRFADDLSGVYDTSTTPTPSQVAHLASPADGARIATGPINLRASVYGIDADRVTVTTDEDPAGSAEIQLQAPAGSGLWWTGAWDITDEELNNVTRTLTLRVFSGGTEVRTDEVTVLVGPEPERARGVVDDFETYANSTALSRNWVPQNLNTTELLRADEGERVGAGAAAMRIAYSFESQTYTGVGRQVEDDWSAFTNLQAWINPDGSGNKLVLQVVADGVAFETYPSLEADAPYLASIPFADWRPAPWDSANADRRLTSESLSKITQFNVFINAVETAAKTGAVSVDEIRAVTGPPPAPTYRDVTAKHPDYAAIQWLHDEVIDLAAGKNRFHPRQAVKRTEFAKTLNTYRPDSVAGWAHKRGVADHRDAAVKLWELAGTPEPDTKPSFRDVKKSDTAYPAIAWATETGLIEPKSHNRFGSNQPVKRAELARWLYAFDSLPAVQPPLTIDDFSTSPHGWTAGGSGTLKSDGNHLVATLDADGWIGLTGAWDLTGRRTLTVDLTQTTGTSTKAAIQVGPSWTWCETNAVERIDGPRTGENAIVLDLNSLSATCADQLDDVRGVNLYLEAGEHHIDLIRAS
ncbi:glycosyl hydrolase [Cellulosimicrobium cellulans]|uniref:glycosyl hydrolase n=1 Tax=Cellulosimicrobium cellulans TaxID=1710 RepID=UPI0028ABC07B|nr:glycosyl hydrolase [Cellulosimicrobium cellulans]